MSRADVSRRLRQALVALLFVLPLLRVAGTWRVFSQTADEPIHLDAGVEWWATRHYDIDLEHPPLARAITALVPYLAGAPNAGDGTAILERNDRYRHNLAEARCGNLAFLALALWVVFAWTRRLFGDDAAIAALAIFGTLPPVLAHAGLTTTDMAAAAATAAALYAFALWQEGPSWRRTAVLGVAIGVGLLCKFSFLLFFPVAAIFLVRRLAIVRALVVAIIAGFLVWAAYLFDIGKLLDAREARFKPASQMEVATRYDRVPGYEWVRGDLIERYRQYGELAKESGVKTVDFVDWAKASGYPSPLAGRNGDTMAGAPPLPRRSVADVVLDPPRAAWQWIAVHVPIPAPNFFAGIEVVKNHSFTGHSTFLLGRYSSNGFVAYFPVVLFFKSPLPFLILVITGMALLRRHPVALMPLAMLLPTLPTSINIGVRHVLPLYPLLAIAAGYAATRIPRALAAVLLAWLFVGTFAAHPDYLAWFNEAAGSHPERIAVDSNLDWGQDLLRLERVVRKEKISHLNLAYFGSADWKKHIPAADDLPPFTPATGWVAVSEMRMVFGPDGERDAYRWLKQYKPVRRVGKTIRLYRIDR